MVDGARDVEVRMTELESGLDALQREVETLREDVRALAAALREVIGAEGAG